MTEQDTTGADDQSRRGRPDRRTFIESDRRVARRLARPLRNFLDIEAAGGLALLVATVAALALANSPAGDSIASFWEQDMTLLAVGDLDLTETIGHWINDGLMAIFFFVVGLEIKRELVTGELRDPRRAALPAIAAIGGMAVPAGMYLLFNVGGDGSRGWGIPVATDIAFAVGVLALLGDRVPSQLKVFLLTLAIVDDIGAIALIAVFYADDLSIPWLATAVALLFVMMAMRSLRVWYMPVYVVVGVAAWVATLESGVHATIAGVAIGLITPARPLRPRPTDLTVGQNTSWSKLRDTVFEAKETMPVAERLQHLVHPWSSFIILPLFAFANAGIELSGDRVGDAVSSPITVGVVVGLVIGKPLGILTLSALALRTGAGTLPRGVGMRHIAGAGALAGIGFTVSIFVTGLAFDEAPLVDEAKIGVLMASVVAAVLGALVLARRSPEWAPE
ncbi:MAG: Na+/H+ antiporter NhaA [Actinomycetota bacterium]|nr:Na+/H+ antiporter NhaA [Actinomycetota bacterium]